MTADRPDNYQPVRKFFGFALSHNPDELYANVGEPAPIALGDTVTEHLIQAASEQQLIVDSELQRAKLLFTAAINDTQAILTEHPLTGDALEALPRIARDERTIHSIARLAIHRNGYVKTALSGYYKGIFFQLSEDLSHIAATERLQPNASGGCPFAMTEDRTIKPDPLFSRTIGFAGDLTYLAHKNEKRA